MTRLDSGTLEKPELETRNGVLVVDKPSGPTSHDVVHQARRLFQTRAIGHAGTLDPMATGVLLLLVGEATKLAPFLTLDKKRYLARITFGTSTDTLDAEGIEIDRVTLAPGLLTRARIERALDVERARTSQVPPSVSAIKVDGQRSYKRVRDGDSVELAPRPVHIASVELLGHHRPAADLLDLEIELVCSSGTYVRAVARDVGTTLGVGGHLTRLRRTRVGPFTMDQAKTLAELEASLDVTPLPAAVRASFPHLVVDEAMARAVRHGRTIPCLGVAGLTGVFDDDGQVLALMEPVHDHLRVVVGFTG
jgi:tRNA pseudouridine55 synthase